MLYILNRDERVVAILNNNGSPDSCPYFNDMFIESLSTGTSSYEFSVPTNHEKSKYIQEGYYVVRKDLDGNSMMFTIMEIEEKHGEQSEKFVFTENTGMEIINAIFRPATYSLLSASEMLDELLKDTRWDKGEVDDFGNRSFTFDEFDNKLFRLQQVANSYDAEISFTVQLKHGEITKRLVNLKQKRGTETKKRFVYNKDITEIIRKVDMTEVVTALIGVGKGDDEGEEYLNFAGESWTIANGDPTNKPLNQDWIGDNEALQRYGIQGNHIFGVYEYNTDSASELLSRTWTRLQQLKDPRITYELDVALLEFLANYEHEEVRLGDTVHVVDETFNPPLYLEARVVELETSFTDPSKNVARMGNFRPAISNISQQLREIQARLLRKEATWDQVGEVIFKDPLPPESPPVGGLWMDTSDPDINVIYRWDGEKWVKASATDPEDIGAFGFQAGTDLEDNLQGIDNRTTNNAIIGTVIDSEEFGTNLDKKANTEDLEGLADTDQVDKAKKEAIDHTDTRLDGEDGVNETIAKVSSDLSKTNSDIIARFRATSGINLLMNSIGYSNFHSEGAIGTDFWDVYGTVNTEQNLELEQLGFGSGFVTSVGEAGYIEQPINTLRNEKYTISFHLKKIVDDATDGFVGVELYDREVKFATLGKDSGTGTTDGYEKFTHTFEAKSNTTVVRVVFENGASAVLTGLMANVGETDLLWSMGQSEIFATNVTMNLNGIRVNSTMYNGYTQITPESFSGHAEVLNENNEPVMQRVFTLNGATTEVKEIDVDSEINMTPIKVVPIESLEYSGWAFIPSQ